MVAITKTLMKQFGKKLLKQTGQQVKKRTKQLLKQGAKSKVLRDQFKQRAKDTVKEVGSEVVTGVKKHIKKQAKKLKKVAAATLTSTIIGVGGTVVGRATGQDGSKQQNGERDDDGKGTQTKVTIVMPGAKTQKRKLTLKEKMEARRKK